VRKVRRAVILASLVLAATPLTGHASVPGMRRLPSPRLALGPLATVRHWDDEYHELEVELEADRVIAVQSRVRRQRVAG
jgi:hypothetical protein